MNGWKVLKAKMKEIKLLNEISFLLNIIPFNFNGLIPKILKSFYTITEIIFRKLCKIVF